jgi:hypothetical protein
MGSSGSSSSGRDPFTSSGSPASSRPKQDLPRCSASAAAAGGLVIHAEGLFDLAAMKDCGPGRTVRLAVLQVNVPELVSRACLSQDSSLRPASSLRRVSNLSSAGRAGRMQAAIRPNPRRVNRDLWDMRLAGPASSPFSPACFTAGSCGPRSCSKPHEPATDFAESEVTMKRLLAGSRGWFSDRRRGRSHGRRDAQGSACPGHVDDRDNRRGIADYVGNQPGIAELRTPDIRVTGREGP